MNDLIPFTSSDILSWTSIREGEIKAGQKFLAFSPEVKSAKYGVVVVPEDIGIRANFGRPGAAESWLPALKALCNIQSNRFFDGTEVMLIGQVNVQEEMNESSHLNTQNPADLDKLRKLTALVDIKVAKVLTMIHKMGLIPIVIGGGHNNAYPNLKALSTHHKMGVNAINLDPHTDLRALEGRHSGNGFSYAMKEGYLSKYFVFGLHENYTSEAIVDHLEIHPDLAYSTFDDLMLRQHEDVNSAMERAISSISQVPFGVEVDLDSLSHVPVSAQTPSGFSVNHARRFVYICGYTPTASYLHLCEGSIGLAGEHQIVEFGKIYAYLISDFIKARNAFL